MTTNSAETPKQPERFTSQKPFTVTEEHLRVHTGGCTGGRLHCNLCGHRFVVGETARWQYAVSKGARNFFVCVKCDGEPAALIARFISMVQTRERINDCLGDGPTRDRGKRVETIPE
jgi:hypothetical protein